MKRYVTIVRMTRLRAKFDGKVLVPSGPVDFRIGQEVDLEVIESQPPTRGSPAAILAAMRAGPQISAEDATELLRSIRTEKRPNAVAESFDDFLQK